MDEVQVHINLQNYVLMKKMSRDIRSSVSCLFFRLEAAQSESLNAHSRFHHPQPSQIVTLKAIPPQAETT